jgi:PAS domain S-box-containing protein
MAVSRSAPGYVMERRSFWRLESWSARFPPVAGGAVAGIGALALAGWIWPAAWLRAEWPGSEAIQPRMAVFYVAAGLALALLASRPASRVRHLAGLACAAAAVVWAALHTLDYLLSASPASELFVFADLTALTGLPFTAGLSGWSAILLLLLGLSPFFLRRDRGGWVWELLIVIPLCMSFLGLVAEAFRIIAVSGPAVARASTLSAVLPFLLLELGLLLIRPDRGGMAILTGDGLGGTLARRLLPVAIGVPFVMAWVRQAAENAGLLPKDLGGTLFALGIVFVQAILVMWYAATVNRADKRRREAEEALRESEQRFKRMADTAPAMLWVAEQDGSCSFLSRGWFEYTGLGRKEGIGYGWLDAVHPDDRNGVRLAYEQAVAGQRPFAVDYRLRRADGEHHWVINTGRPRLGPKGEYLGMIGAVIDVHERNQAEGAMRAAQAQLRIVTDNMAVAVTRCSRELRFLWVNPGYAAWLGHPAEAIIGKRIDDVLGADAFTVIRPHIQRVLAGERVEFEARVPYHGIGPRWVNASYVPTQDAEGRIDGWVAVITDTTQRRELEEELRRTDRRKDEFLAALAHELRNPLAPIRNSLVLLQLAGGNGKGTQEPLAVMERQLNHLIRIVDDLLDVSRITRNKIELRKERVPLSRILQSAVETSRPLIDAGGHVLTVTQAQTPVWVYADFTRMAQVVSNLLNNAAKYTPERGRIGLITEVEGDQVLIRVRDSGVGIPGEMLPHVFEMFTQVGQTRGNAQGGLGIGLTLVKSFVEMHGGTVQAQSAGLGPGKRVHRPAADRSRRSGGPAGAGVRIAPGSSAA